MGNRISYILNKPTIRYVRESPQATPNSTYSLTPYPQSPSAKSPPLINNTTEDILAAINALRKEKEIELSEQPSIMVAQFQEVPQPLNTPTHVLKPIHDVIIGTLENHCPMIAIFILPLDIDQASLNTFIQINSRYNCQIISDICEDRPDIMICWDDVVLAIYQGCDNTSIATTPPQNIYIGTEEGSFSLLGRLRNGNHINVIVLKDKPLNRSFKELQHLQNFTGIQPFPMTKSCQITHHTTASVPTIILSPHWISDTISISKIGKYNIWTSTPAEIIIHNGITTDA